LPVGAAQAAQRRPAKVYHFAAVAGTSLAPGRKVSLPRASFLATIFSERAIFKLGQFAVNFLKNEDGPTAVEYAVVLALSIVVCIAAISALGSNAEGTFNMVGSTVNTASGS
jgi:pilus assembly protein Flp/PilA